MNQICILFSTIDDRRKAEQIASQLVQEKLAACVSIIPDVVSVYKWEGKVQHEGECLLVLKTRQERLDPLISRLAEIHPYQVPEIVAFPVIRGYLPYLEWVMEETSPEKV